MLKTKTDVQEITDALLVVHYNLLCALSKRTNTDVENRLESSLISVQNALNDLKHIRTYEYLANTPKPSVWSLWRRIA
jgi:hypothetical protein